MLYRYTALTLQCIFVNLSWHMWATDAKVLVIVLDKALPLAEIVEGLVVQSNIILKTAILQMFSFQQQSRSYKWSIKQPCKIL